MTELSGLVDVVGMSFANGNLAIADEARAASGSRFTRSPGERRAESGSDDRRPRDVRQQRWPDEVLAHGRLRDGRRRQRLRLRTAAGLRQLRPGRADRQVRTDGPHLWRKSSTAYISSAVAGPPSDPTWLIQGNFNTHRLDPDTGDSDYLGSAMPPGMGDIGGVARNAISSVAANAASPMRWGTIAGQTFLGFAGGGGRGLSIFKRVINDTTGFISLHCVAVVSGCDTVQSRRMTWHDAAGTGYPLQADVSYYGPAIVADPNVRGNFGFAADGAIWFTYLGEVWKLPCSGLSPQGNPTYNWADRRQGLRPRDRRLRVPLDSRRRPPPQGPYLLVDDLTLAPYTSATPAGARRRAAAGPSSPSPPTAPGAVDAAARVLPVARRRRWLGGRGRPDLLTVLDLQGRRSSPHRGRPGDGGRLPRLQVRGHVGHTLARRSNCHPRRVDQSLGPGHRDRRPARRPDGLLRHGDPRRDGRPRSRRTGSRRHTHGRRDSHPGHHRGILARLHACGPHRWCRALWAVEGLPIDDPRVHTRPRQSR